MLMKLILYAIKYNITKTIMMVAPDGKSSNAEVNSPIIEPIGHIIADAISKVLKSLKYNDAMACGIVKYAIARIIPITFILCTIANATKHISIVLKVLTGRL